MSDTPLERGCIVDNEHFVIVAIMQAGEYDKGIANQLVERVRCQLHILVCTREYVAIC
jgi:hypothetical protein